MNRRYLGLILLGCLPLAANAQCGGAAKLAEYRSTPPLLAGQDDVSYQVSVHADGCVSARFPKQDLRHGEARLQLAATELAEAIAQIRASRVAEIDPEALRTRLRADARKAAREADTTFYKVSDENIIEFVLPSRDKSAEPVALAWRSLRNDLLNAPKDAELARMAALQQVFEELADRAQAAREVTP